MSTVPVFAPTGELGDIPAERLADAVKAGFKPGVHVQSADGKDGVIPAARTADAVKAGMKIVPIQDQPIKHPGFWSTLSNDLVGMVSGAYHGIVDYDPLTDPNLPDSQKNAIVTAQQNAAAAKNQERTQAHGKAYSLGATAAEMLGTNVSGMEQSAEQGDVGGVMGHAATVPAVMAATEGAMRGAGAVSDAASRARALWEDLPAETQKSLQTKVLGTASPRLRNALELKRDLGNILEALKKPGESAPADPSATPEAAQSTPKSGEMTPQGWYYLGRLQEIAKNIAEEEAKTGAPKNVTPSRAAALKKPLTPPASSDDLTNLLQESVKRAQAAKGKPLGGSLADLQ